MNLIVMMGRVIPCGALHRSVLFVGGVALYLPRLRVTSLEEL